MSKRTKKNETVGTIVNVPLTAIAAVPALNMARLRTKSHKPRNIKKMTTDEQANARVWHTMHEAAKAGQPMWDVRYPMVGIAWQNAETIGLIDTAGYADHLASLPATIGDCLDRVPQIVTESGYCRYQTVIDIATDLGLPLSSIMVPVRIVEHSSRRDYQLAQTQDNSRLGVNTPSIPDYIASAVSLITSGHPLTSRSDYIRALGVKAGTAQKVYRAIRLDGVVPGFVDSILRKSTKEVKATPPKVLEVLARESIDALLTDRDKQQGQALATATTAIATLVDKTVADCLAGTHRKSKVNPVAVWSQIFGNYVEGSIGKVFQQDHTSGEGFTTTVGLFGQLLNDPNVIEVYKAGLATLAASSDSEITPTELADV